MIRRIAAILVKDLRDAWRDGRIVVLLLMPIGIALIPSFGTDADRPTTSIAIVEPAGGGLAAALGRAAGKAVQLEFEDAPTAAAARRLIVDEKAEVAVIVTGKPPVAEILVGESASPAAQSVVALVPDALLRATGREPPQQPSLKVIASGSRIPFDVVDPAVLTVIFSIVILLSLVGMMVVPIQTGEELEKGTFGALRMATTVPEILAAKALAGYVFGAAGVGLVVLLTGVHVEHPVAFAAATLGLIFSLTGFGLLVGLLVPNTNAINTYGAFLLTPLVGSALVVFAVDSGTVATILDLLPFSAGAELLADGASDPAPFDAGLTAWLAIAVWGIAGYAAVVRIATRREM